MARRRLAVLGLVATSALFGCRPDTVSVAFTPEVGDRYSYRYEIDATITRHIEGVEPEVVRIETELVAHQEVRDQTSDGFRMQVELTRERGAPRTALVVVDRAGSLEGIELVEGLGAAVLGVADSTSLVPTRLGAPPDRPLAPGDRWTVRQGARRASGRLERLGVADGRDVAVVSSTVVEDVDEARRAGTGDALVSGVLRSTTTTTYDLLDGAVRRSTSRSRGRLGADLAPPPDVQADPVHATIGYEITVRVIRTA